MKKRPAYKHSAPIVIREGNVTVRITTEENVVQGTAYARHTIIYFDGGQRIRRRFSDLGEARTEAELIAIKLANRDGEALKLKPEDRASYLQAMEMLRSLDPSLRLNMAIREFVDARKNLGAAGVKLDVAASELAHATSKLPPGVSLLACVEDFAKATAKLPPDVTLLRCADEWTTRNCQVRASKSVPDLVEEYLATKEKAARSPRHLRDLRHRLRPFAEQFQTQVAELKWEQLQTYIDGLDVGARSKLNVYRHIRALLIFACKRKYAPRELLEELHGVQLPESSSPPTRVFTPAHAQEIFDALVAHRPDLIPAITLSAFCGLRTAEVLRIDWKELLLDEGVLEVVANKAKTASRRTVPLGPAALAWLLPHRRKEGPVCPVTGENRLYEAVLASVKRQRSRRHVTEKFLWIKNGFRHGWCSYRLALSKDVNLTALEAGNSAQMIHGNYKSLVSERQAREWFAIVPPDGYGANTVPMPVAAKA